MDDSTDKSTEAKAARPARSSNRSIAFFTGADPKILAESPSEKHFHDKLGLAVVLLSCLSAACVTATFALMWEMSFLKASWTGLMWLALLLFGLERLVLTGVERSRWMLLGIIPRVVLSVLIAFIFAESAILALNNGAIGDQLARTNAAKAQSDRTRVNHDFDPKITRRKRDLATLKRRELDVAGKVEANRFRAQCESGLPGCSYTGRSGNGAFYFHYRRQAEAAQARLDAMRRAHRPRVETLNTEIADLRTAKAAEISDLKKGVDGNTDINARKHALAQLQKERPEINAMVWFLRIFFLTIDLLPLGVKVQRSLKKEGSTYEALEAAFGRQERVAALKMDAEAQVEEQRIQDQMRADIEANRAIINFELDARIDAAMGSAAFGNAYVDSHGNEYGGEYTATAHGSPPSAPRRPALGLIEASDLDDYVDRISLHEAQKVDVPADLRRGALIGFALGAALAIFAAVMAAVGRPLSGTWLILVGVVATACLAIYTGGFRRAPAWGLRAMFGSLLASIALPVLILLMNL